MSEANEHQTLAVERVAVFIDGSNLYHALREKFKLGKTDMAYLVRSIVGARKLTSAFFYNAEVDGKKFPDGAKSQARFFAAIRRIPKFVVRLGRQRHNGDGGGSVEKGVDVQLVVDMLSGAFRQEYDTAVLVSGDGDFEPAVKAVRACGCRVELAFPDCSSLARQLRDVTDVHVILEPGRQLKLLAPSRRT